MIRKFYLINFFVLIQFFIFNISYSNVKIIVSVDDEIITNYDVLKESRYLKILSPSLKNLDETKLKLLAKESLIKEIIKKKEISKFIDLGEENFFLNEYFINFLNKLGYENEKIFNNNLIQNQTYSIEEVKQKIKIEIFWNDLIFNRFKNQISVDKRKLDKKLDDIENKEKKEFLLSEIIFKKKKDEKIEDTISKIKQSIDEIGFNNTANIYSISESSKFGGKIGWVKEDALTKKILKNIVNLNINQYSNVINLNDNFIILMVNDIKIIQNKIDREKVLRQLIDIETNRKLEKFSRIYFSKAQAQYFINEK